MKYKKAPISSSVQSLIFTAVLAAASVSAYAAESGSAGWLLICNKGDHALGIIDPVAGKQIATIPEDGVTGHEVIASADGKRAFVPIYGDSGVGKAGTDGQLIRVIDLEKRAVVGTVDFGKGVRPHCAMIGPKNGLLYVTTELDKTITEIDPASLKILRTIPTGQEESHMLILSHNGKRGYTANVAPGTVSVLDMEAGKLLKVIPVSKNVQRIAISTDDRWVYTADQTKPQLAVISTADDKVSDWISLPGMAYGTAPTPDGRWLLVTQIKDNKVVAVDLKTMKVAHTFDVPRAPQEIVVRPDSGEAYVSCDASKKVAILDLKEWKVDKLVDAGAGADGLAWAKRE